MAKLHLNPFSSNTNQSLFIAQERFYATDQDKHSATILSSTQMALPPSETSLFVVSFNSSSNRNQIREQDSPSHHVTFYIVECPSLLKTNPGQQWVQIVDP